MSEDGMPVGTEKVSRMTSLKVLVLILATAGLIPDAHSKASVYSGVNVYKPTINKWKSTVESASFDSTSWLWSLGSSDRKHKNGSRDTILMVPTVSVPDDITLIVWFHGLNGFSKKTFEKRLIPQIEDIVENGNSIAVAIPEMPWSINTSTPRKRQGKVWTRPGELEQYVKSIKERLEAWAIITHGVDLGSIRIVFVGHSAGGSALMSASREGSLCRLGPEAIVWSDASYGHWLDSAWKGCIKEADTELHILVRKWDKPHKNAQRLIKRMTKRSRLLSKPDIHYKVLNRKHWTHGRIGNNVFVLTNLFPPGC